MFIPCSICENDGSARSGSVMCVSCEQNKSTIDAQKSAITDLEKESDKLFDETQDLKKERDKDTARIFDLEGQVKVLKEPEQQRKLRAAQQQP